MTNKLLLLLGIHQMSRYDKHKCLYILLACKNIRKMHAHKKLWWHVICQAIKTLFFAPQHCGIKCSTPEAEYSSTVWNTQKNTDKWHNNQHCLIATVLLTQNQLIMLIKCLHIIQMLTLHSKPHWLPFGFVVNLMWGWCTVYKTDRILIVLSGVFQCSSEIVLVAMLMC